MSDTPVAAAPVADASPAAPSAPVVAPEGAGAPAAAPKPAPVDTAKELGEFLKSKGGLTLKAGGKTYKVDSVEKLLGWAQRGIPLEEGLATLAQQRRELEPMAQALQQLREGDEDAAEEALARLVDEGKLSKLMMRRLQREYESQERMQGLSPKEREMQQELETLRAEKQKGEAELRQRQQQEQQQKERQQVDAVKNHISQQIIGALEQMGLPPKLEPMAVEFMKPFVRTMIQAGMPLDPKVLAEKVGPIFDEMLAYRAKALEGEKLLSFFGPDVGKKFRAALLAKMNSAAKPAVTEPTQGQPAVEKLDFRQGF